MKTILLRKIVAEILAERSPLTTNELVSAFAKRRRWGTSPQALGNTLARYPEFDCVGPKGSVRWFLVGEEE
jgi:hypothetical protein